MSWWNNYLRVPFMEKGRSAGGADCWGLAKLVYEKELNIILPGYEDCYKTTNDREELAKTIDEERNQKWINPKEPKEFDIIILNMQGVPMHVGIVTRPGFMLHCQKGINTVHVPYNTMQWKDKVVGFARWDN